MNAILGQPQRAETIGSVTLADLQFDPPSSFDRLKSLARMALMLWGALAFGAAAGTAAYFVAGTGEPILVARASTEAPASEAPRETNKTTVALAEIPPHLSEFVGKFEANTGEALPDPVEEARMPRPRPDEPVYTGSVERPRQVVRRRAFSPCQALADLGARYVFGLRCRQARVYAPPPAPQSSAQVYYYPEPYRPPHVVR